MEYIYFDLEQARKLLPWLKEKLRELIENITIAETAMEEGNYDILSEVSIAINKLINDITEKGVIIRDPKIGLVDFPAIINDRPAFLCWKLDEDDIQFWHYAEEGFAGRKRISGKEEILSFQ